MIRVLRPKPFLAAAATLALAACVGDDIVDKHRDAGAGDAANPADGLYTRLGGDTGISAIIDAFIGRVSADPKINGFFLNSSVNTTRLSTCLKKQLSALSGGPATYPGPNDPPDGDGCRNMRQAHLGLGISTNDFTDLGTDLVIELANRGTTSGDIDAVIRAINPLADDIVENPNNNETIYLRAQRKPGVTAVIRDFLGRVLADEKINGYFLNSSLNADRLATCLVRQVCQVTGGPCKYGEEIPPELFGGTPCQPMSTVHHSLGISAHDFGDLASDLVSALRAHGLPKSDIDQIVGVIAPLSSDIVTDPSNNATVYQRLDRKPAIHRVISNFVARVSADPKINGYFLNSTINGARLETCLVRQVCAVSGGPCRYGEEAPPELFGSPCRSMVETHRNLGVSTQDFNDLVADLVGAFTASSAISQADLSTVADAVLPLASQIVEDQNGEATIYQRIGRKPAIVGIINDFVGRVLADNTLAGFFTRTHAERLGTCLVRQVCGVSSGPCKYGYEAGRELFDGVPCREMVPTHRGLTNPPGGGAPITRADFDALVGHLVDAMVASGTVSVSDRATIVGVLAPLCSQIVDGANGC